MTCEPSDRLGCYLVEWYRGEEWQNESFSHCFATLRAGTQFVDDDGTPATVLMTLSVPTDDAIFCVFAADSAESVVLVCDAAGLPPQRVTAAVAIGMAERPSAKQTPREP